MLWHTYPDTLDQLTLQDAYQTLNGDPASRIPFWVWLFENPDSPLTLPGKIDLYHHDCLHLLLKQGFNSAGEAYVVGFTMGNDPNTSRLHCVLLKLAAQFLYPQPYRFSKADLQHFDAGYARGRTARIHGLNQKSFEPWNAICLPQLRQALGL